MKSSGAKNPKLMHPVLYSAIQNQHPGLQPNSLYASIMPVHSSSQIFDGCQLREISSQPQTITTQASETIFNQAKFLGLQTVNALPPGLSWAPSGQLCQNPLIIYSQPSGMTVHQPQPQMTMHLPIAAARRPVPTTFAVVAPQRQKYPKVSQSSLLDSRCRVLLPKKTNFLEERENSLTVLNQENNVRAPRLRTNVERAKCVFCGKLGSKFRFRTSKRFCSNDCATQFNKHIPKRVKRPLSAMVHVGSGGRGRKRKRFKGRNCFQNQLLVEKESSNAMSPIEILPTSEKDSMVPDKTDENSAPIDNSHHTNMEVEKSNEEIGLLNSDISQKLPSKWTVQDVFEFIQNVPGCSEYADNFKSQEVDGQALLLLNEAHLKRALCMKLGPALKLLSQVRSIKDKF